MRLQNVTACSASLKSMRRTTSHSGMLPVLPDAVYLRRPAPASHHCVWCVEQSLCVVVVRTAGPRAHGQLLVPVLT